MLGAQRRVEARIGELLGEAKRGGKADEQLDSRMSESLPRPDDRAEKARTVGGLVFDGLGPLGDLLLGDTGELFGVGQRETRTPIRV